MHAPLFFYAIIVQNYFSSINRDPLFLLVPICALGFSVRENSYSVLISWKNIVSIVKCVVFLTKKVFLFYTLNVF